MIIRNSPFSGDRTRRDFVNALPGLGIVMGAGLGGTTGLLLAGANGLVTGGGVGVGVGLVVGAIARMLLRDDED